MLDAFRSICRGWIPLLQCQNIPPQFTWCFDPQVIISIHIFTDHRHHDFARPRRTVVRVAPSHIVPNLLPENIGLCR